MSTDDQANLEYRLAGRPRVLVVDDNNMNCLVAWNYCEAFGCEVETACDGEEAVEFCTAKHYDIILMDVRMPRLDGIVAAARIRNLPDQKGQMAIVMVTGEGDLSDRDTECCQVSGVLLKPYSMRSLFEAVRDALASGRTLSASEFGRAA